MPAASKPKKFLCKYARARERISAEFRNMVISLSL